MNPHASTQCTGRLLMALAAITSILFAVGCGSSSAPPPPNQVGFSNSSLSGTYVFSSQGADLNGYPVAMAGTLVANGTGGTGGITGGTIDIIDPDPNFSPPPQVAQSITGGSYSVGSDGRGEASLTSAYGTYVLDFVLTSTSHGLVAEFDGYGGGSGTIDLQTAVTGLSQLAGPYAFSLAGSDSALNPFAAAGAFTLNSSGIIAEGNGIEDFNDGGGVGSESLTGTATMGSGTGPESITFPTSSFPNAVFDFYPIDATHWKMIETDYNDFLAGDVFTQTGFSSIPTNTPLAFSMSGGVSAAIANAGYMTYNGSSFSGTEDYNNNGSYVPQTGFTGQPGTVGAVGGRVVVTLTDFTPATTVVVYPSSGGLLMLETDDLNVTSGAAYAQTPGAALAASQAYGFNLSAYNSSGGYDEDDIAQFTTTSTDIPGVIDVNDNYFNGLADLNSYSLGGSYTLDSPATGRGEAATTAGGTAYIGFNFYAVTSSQFLVLETDTTTGPVGAQIGAGIFESQTAPGAGGAAKSRVAIVHPAVRPHGALRRK